MSEPKVRRVDYSPDELIAGVAGRLRMEGVGLYWMICSLIYSRGGPIDDDPVWLSRFFAGTSARRVRGVLDGLVASGKVSREFGEKGAKLSANRTQTELKLASNRIQTARKNGANGGRPSSKINDLQNRPGYFPGNLSSPLTSNDQPSSPLGTDDRNFSEGKKAASPQLKLYPGIDVNAFERELRNALGAHAPPIAADFSSIVELLDAGYQPIKDVLAGCREVAEKASEPIGSWAYYAVAIARRPKTTGPVPVSWLKREAS